MLKVFRTEQADEDLLEIWSYIADDDMDMADRIIERIHYRCESLAQYPERGTERPDLMPGMRYLVEGNYLIFYRIRSEFVEVLRILNGKRNLYQLF